MKRIFFSFLTILLILGVLGAKVYMDQLEQPRYYLLQIGSALEQHNLKQFRQWVDVKRVAQSLVDDFFQGVAIKPSKLELVKALKKELAAALVVQLEEYVKTGQFKRPVLMELSKEARSVLPELNLSEQEVMQFKEMKYLKDEGPRALAGFSDMADPSSRLALEIELEQVPKAWKVVKINHFKEIKTRLQRRKQQKNVKHEDLLVQGMKNTVLWGKFDREEVFLELTNPKNDDTWPANLVIGEDQNQKPTFVLNNGGEGITLQLDPAEVEGFNQDGQLNRHYYIQAGEYDFDKDDKSEIVIAVGDNRIDLVVNIFKFNPTKDKDAGKKENWVLVGVFMGQIKAQINGRQIKLPYPAIKIESNYKWMDNQFVELK